MVEDTWEELAGKRLQYADRTWELTGSVDVRGTGERVELEAKEVNDVRHRRAALRFVTRTPSDSLNPGNLGEHFDRLERDGDVQTLVVKKGGRTYRYELRGLEYE